MRLERFEMRGQYRILRDLAVEFACTTPASDERRYALDFVVGVNGSGKSTFLRALTQGMRDLRANRSSRFGFTLQYVLHGGEGAAQRVKVKSLSEQEWIDSGPDAKRQPPITMMIEDIGPGQGARRALEGVESASLPQVVVYTSGSEADWEALAASGQVSGGRLNQNDLPENQVERALRELPGHMAVAEIEEQPADTGFILIPDSRRASVTLCGLLYHLCSGSRPLQKALDAVGVDSVAGFSLEFRFHKASLRQSDEEDFERLRNRANRHVHQGSGHLLWFELGPGDGGNGLAGDILQEMGSGSAFGFYQLLDRLQAPDSDEEAALKAVNVILRMKANDAGNMGGEGGSGATATSLRWLEQLSDGEQSFLGGMALLAMLDGNNMLVLLDEPEVHFNDFWKREIVSTLDQVLAGHANHVLITSHSSITLSDVHQEDVTVFKRKAERGETAIEALPAQVQTYGSDPSDIMVHVFQAPAAVGGYSTDQLGRLLERNDPGELGKALEGVAPGYWHYRIRRAIGQGEI